MLYTKTGDNGTTSLIGGTRVAKDDVRLEAYGAVDELNAHLGLLSAATPAYTPMIAEMQSRLFDIGAILADPAGTVAPLPEEAVLLLERNIDALEAMVPPMRCFVLPAGNESACRAHVARTVARRAERRIVTLAAQASVPAVVVRYINRLSDLLFALARALNHAAGIADIPWKPSQP